MKRSPHFRKGHATVLVIDSFELRRAGVASLLKPWADSNGLRVVEVDPHGTVLESRPGASDHPYKLILLVIGAAGVGDPEPQNWITSLSGAYAHVPLVLVSDREDAKEVLAALEAGVSGFIPTSIALPVAMQALTFIVGGGSFFPPAALTEAARSDHSLQTSSRRGVTVVATASMDHSGLTARQQQVLEHLRQGESNKLIGRHLKLRESTVKVHIRHIMRKLGAINRTQAALSAVHLHVSTTGAEASVNAGQNGADDDVDIKDWSSSRMGGDVLELADASRTARTRLLPSEERGTRVLVKSGLRPTSK